MEEEDKLRDVREFDYQPEKQSWRQRTSDRWENWKRRANQRIASSSWDIPLRFTLKDDAEETPEEIEERKELERLKGKLAFTN